MSKVIQIPLKDSGKTYDIKLEKLPEYDKVNAILKTERTELHLWIKLALEYYEKNKVRTFISLLESAHTFASLDYKKSKLDQIKLIDMMAAYYVQMAKREKRQNKRNEYIKMVTQLYTANKKLFVHNKYHLLGCAYTSLLNNKKTNANADNHFDTLLSNLFNNKTPEKLGIACSAFKKKDYSSALTIFINVLQSDPHNYLDIQLGIAYCHWKLGDINKATIAFEFIIMLEPTIVDTLMGFAVMKLDSEKPNLVNLTVHLTSIEFVLNKCNSDTLNHLATHFYVKKKHVKAELYAKHANINSNDDLSKSESYFLLGKLYHAQTKYNLAFEHYSKSISCAPATFIFPYFGLSQMYMHKNNYEKAIQCIEKVIEVEPKNYKALKIMGTLYASVYDEERLSAGKKFIEKLIEKYPNDAYNWVCYGQLLEKTNLESSLSAYYKAYNIMHKIKDKLISPELINNIALLHYKLNNFDESLSKFKESLSLLKQVINNDRPYYKSMIIITKFNLGRNLEKLQQPKKARPYYKEIVMDQPNYIDSHLRLGCIAKDFNEIQEAFDCFTETIRFDYNNFSAWTYLGELNTGKAQWEDAEKKFNLLLCNPLTLNDSSGLITKGHYWLQTLYNTLEDKNNGIICQNLVLKYFITVLKNDTTSTWAINGIDHVLAIENCSFKAKHVFAELAEDGSTDFCSVFLSFARKFVDEKLYISAIKTYELCLKRFFKRDNMEILEYIRSTYVKSGQLKEALNICMTAFKIAPCDRLVLFNIAYVIQKLSIQMINYKRSQLKDVLQAISKLKVSQKFFQNLSVLGENKYFYTSFAVTKTENYQMLLDDAKHYIAVACALSDKLREMYLKQEMEAKLLKIKEEEERIKEEERKTAISNEPDECKLKPRRRRRINKNKKCEDDEASSKVSDNPKNSNPSHDSAKLLPASGSKPDSTDDTKSHLHSGRKKKSKKSKSDGK